MDNTEKKLRELEERVVKLESRRILQQDIMPTVIKNRHMGEANSYFFSGVASKRPTGATFGNNTTYYFATDTNVLSVWNGTAWKSTTLT